MTLQPLAAFDAGDGAPGPHGTASAGAADLAAPTNLIAPSRLLFRRVGLEAVERAAEAHEASVSIDMSAVQSIDSSGLGVLVLVYKRSAERGLRVRLHGVPPHVRELLELTRLSPLFDFVG
jgi:ABC-type transporter Mla MlaB component